MKRITAIFLAFLMLISFVSCKSDDNGTDGTVSITEASNEVTSDTSETEAPTAPSDGETGDDPADLGHTGVKIEGEISHTSGFSEGLAFVYLDGNKDKAYCIDKDGYIIFEVEKKDLLFSGGTSISMAHLKFINGFALLAEAMCDNTGKITYPEDVGATTFYNNALEGGYILAERVTSDYASSKKEFGVMNTSFEWVVEPSEELYNVLSDSHGYMDLDRVGINVMDHSYYHNDTFYFERRELYLDLKTGEVSETSDQEVPSDAWVSSSSGTKYKSPDGKVQMKLEDVETAMHVSGANYFANGKAPLFFKNEDKCYFTFIDESGKFSFEPVDIGATQINYMYYDGQNLLLKCRTNDVRCYDMSGNLVGEYKLNDRSIYGMSEGVITVRESGKPWSAYYFYNPDFTPLF